MLAAASGNDATAPMKVTMMSSKVTMFPPGLAGSDTTGSPSTAGTLSDSDQDPGAPPGLLPPPSTVTPIGRTPLRKPERTPLRSHAEAYVPSAYWAVPDYSMFGGEMNQKKPAKEKIRVEKRTTVMICHLPFSYTCNTLIDLLDSKGYSTKFDFVYVPINFTAMLGVGYAFVDFTSHDHAKEFMVEFEGFDGWASSFSKKPCELRWSDCQGLDDNIARYRNSPIMGPEVPGFYKPALFKDGERMPFPKPTQKLRPLKSRRSRNQHVMEKIQDGE